ncbi:5'-nucleotidase C-terminal domain-containing protein [Paenibacillus sp. ACRRX]|uniref:bifunctional metallophosphatase/5'-nucleotidase n=1 Tax=Paenibacillus sp. ACRRX TaxID=2918206 RepID=UPI001EF55F9A|nr:5'-nucleotidase C-terminal domain-containing protein [Paenibacillus sp. ACRRX]MCG7408685.1 5'-nucleotidase C-terminal domain-containing protein [Paenibacillus sp. ACRRX]
MIRINKLGLTLSLTAILASVIAGPLAAAPLQPIQHTDWMQQKAYINGANDGLALERPITLVEAVVVLARVQGEEAKVKEVDASVKGSWAARALTWAKQGSIVNAEQWTRLHKTADAATLSAIAKQAGIDLKLDGSTVTRQAFIDALGEAITLHLTIGHTNDVHGHIMDDEKNKEMGYAKLATLMKSLKAENPNTMLVDAGDMIQGTIYVNLSKGEAATKLVNPLGYDFMVAGNHEFDFGHEQLVKVSKMFQFPVLGANVFDAKGELLLKPYVIKEIEGKKFAFLGLITEETPIVTHPDNVKGLKFLNPVTVAKEWVPKLQQMADQVIIVSHSGLTEDREIAKQVKGVDLIIGGHSHTKLSTPEVVNGVYIVQDWEYSKSLGRVDMYYHNGEVVHFSGGLIEYNKDTKPDEETAARVAELQKHTDTLLSEKIAKTAVKLEGDRTKIRAEGTNLGNLIADAMLERTRSMPGFEADVALTNGGGIRTTIQAGDITKRNLYDVLPFPNTLAVVEAKGSELRAALESGVSEIESGAGRFPQIAGMTFTFDMKLKAGSRVSDVKVGGKALDDNKTYRVATNDFIIAGGDGYSMLKKDALNTGVTLYEVVEDYIIKKGDLSPADDGRINKLK